MTMEIGTVAAQFHFLGRFVSNFWYWFLAYSIVLGLLLAPVVHGEYILGDPAELHDDVVCV